MSLLPLKREPSYNTPGITFDPESGLLEFVGRCIPEHASSFFEPLVKWIITYVNQAIPATHVVVKLDYINSSSQKYMVEMLEHLTSIARNGKEVAVDWYYETDDEETRETGEDISENVAYGFNYIEVKRFNA